MVALRRLKDAQADGDKIYAIIRGLGSSSDGKSKSIYAPDPEGQALAIKKAYKRAGYGMDEVELIEATSAQREQFIQIIEGLIRLTQ